MLIKSIALENIRSYLKERIELESGKILLQGDIGSGKSTILLSIEFALFGILRGMLAGNSLLRHGEREGSVTLEFIVNNRHVFIRRLLKRTSAGIEQDEGALIIDGVVQNLTPTELKVRVLELLGYPAELLTKSKSLLFRYTVYTAQEDMKRIIFESTESRLDVLRRVFDIDRYRRVQENLQPILRALRDEQRTCDGIIIDLAQKMDELDVRKNERMAIIQKRSITVSALSKAQEELTRVQKEFDALEKKIQEVRDTNMRRAVLQSRHDAQEQQRAQLAARIHTLHEELAKFTSPFADTVDFASMRTQARLRLSAAQNELGVHTAKIASCKTMMGASREVMIKIGALSQCPLCMQEVSIDHKQGIDQRETEKIAHVEQELTTHFERSEHTRIIIETFTRELERLESCEREQLVRIALVQEHERKRVELHSVLAQLEPLDALQQEMCESLRSLIAQDSAPLEEQLRLARSVLTHARENERALAIENSEFVKREQFIHELITKLEDEIETKLLAKTRAANLAKYHDWLNNFFSPLASNIEKHVFARIHRGFNDVFVQWFNDLVQDESFTARLDEQFTPLIEQNGYETTLESLSGGEKTACALAYRLALNHVINTILQTIHTRDVLILDEPTDGFSSEQLDRMREVLNTLALSQIIIVSHERKIESFVDTVIRVAKHESVSAVIR